MRIIKLGLISVVVLFLIATCIGLLMPANVVVSRAINITAPKDSVFSMMKDIRQWKKWIEGMNNEGVIVISSTEADLAGTKVKIVATDNYAVQSNWIGKRGTVQESIMRVIQDSTSPALVAQWQFTEHLKWYPWQHLGSMMNEAVMGTQLENNLAGLKKIFQRY
jgi:hypothetical protein